MPRSKAYLKTRSEEFARLYQVALDAGEVALEPMMGDDQWGCGFAEVCVNGNGAFGRWAVREKGWLKRSSRGVSLSISYPLVPERFWQSENHKATFARAFAAVLRNAGISVWVESHSD
jgi:hypothetical protein